MPDTGPEAGVKGIVEDVKGKAKEVAGEVTGNARLEREGEAQQSKAEAQREVAIKEGEAEKARAEAEIQEAQQKANQ
ncbi:MAG TPA: CsbD family protein [Actinomycetota bacterium]|nr:CsbD family protein [Actinomycetota bacterium]